METFRGPCRATASPRNWPGSSGSITSGPRRPLPGSGFSRPRLPTSYARRLPPFPSNEPPAGGHPVCGAPPAAGCAAQGRALCEQLLVIGDESPHIDQRVPLKDVARAVAGNVVEMEMERGDAEGTDILWNLGDAADVPVPAAGTLQLDGHLAEYRTKDIAMPSLVAERTGEGVTPSVLCPPVSPEPRRPQPLPARPW